jgi:hypothetical protein
MGKSRSRSRRSSKSSRRRRKKSTRSKVKRCNLLSAVIIVIDIYSKMASLLVVR